MKQVNTEMVNWAVVCVNEFARCMDISPKIAFQYLYKYGGIEFLKEFYQAEHTLSLDNAVEDLGIVCRNRGGHL